MPPGHGEQRAGQPMTRLPDRRRRLRIFPLPILLVLLQCLAPGVYADAFSVGDAQGGDVNVQQMPADGRLLIIWLVDHAEQRPLFESMLKAVNAAGVELWRVDLLDDYFLPRGSESVRTLSGEGVAALIAVAHQRSQKTILLAAYDRMPLPLLRGANLWQSRHEGESRLAGALLFYPNLFDAVPPAGVEPQLDPVVHATTLPVTLFQPVNGNHRWRLKEVMESFWAAGSPAFVYLVPGVRDWYFMHEQGKDPAETAATAAVPRLVQQFADIMAARPDVPGRPVPRVRPATASRVLGLTPLSPVPATPVLDLPTVDGGRISLDDYRGRVTLVNFWATWCPPCVEEVPSLNRLQQSYRNEPFALVSVDFRETEQQVRAFMDRIPVAFPILLDHDGLTSLAWKVFSFPSSFLLDKAGRLRYSVNRAIDWDEPQVRSLVQQLLDE